MKASIKAKSTLAYFFDLAGVTSWKLRQFAGEHVAVLMYHRVIPPNQMDRGVQAGMVVEPATLDLHLRYLRRHFEIVPLANLTSPQRCGEHGRNVARCVLTFDDGWRDFYEHAYPILRTHRAPATVFLPTDFIGTDRWFWTDRVGRLLDHLEQAGERKSPASAVKEPVLREAICAAGTYEQRLERVIGLLKTYRLEDIEGILSELTNALGRDAIPAGRAFLSWEEVREMAGSGLVSFGSHTAAHPLLTTLTEQEVQHELGKSKDALLANRAADAACISFSYPNGDHSARLSAMVREAGYQLAVTTQPGWFRCGTDSFTIPRISAHQDITSTVSLFSARVADLL